MITDRFSLCLPYILKDEGGNDENLHDPGGRTSRGVIQREYDVYRRSKGEAIADVWEATDAEIADIYHTQYWEPYCNKLPTGLDYLYFDMAVNMGSHEAALLLQRGLGVTADGHIGIVTLDAAMHSNPVRVIGAVSDAKTVFYKSLHTFKYFGKGWLARVASVESVADKMAIS